MSTYTNSIKTKTHPILVKTEVTTSFLDTMQHTQFDWPNQHNRPIQQNKPNNVIKDKGKHQQLYNSKINYPQNPMKHRH